MSIFYTYSRKLCVISVICAALSGCAELSQEVSAPPSTVVRACHENIALGGRFSVRYWQHGREEALHGSFQWVQAGKRTSITLLSPLGQTIATIDVMPDTATLTMAGQAPRIAADADALAAAALGWPLPVSGLRDWLQGCGLTGNPGSSGVNTRDGWHLDYPVWENDAVAVSRPKRINLRRQAGAGEMSLRLVIDTWQPGGR